MFVAGTGDRRHNPDCVHGNIDHDHRAANHNLEYDDDNRGAGTGSGFGGSW